MNDNTAPARAEGRAKLSPTGLFHLSVVYVIWSTTYLAIRVAVAPGGFRPFVMGTIRMVFAGLILLAFSMATRNRLYYWHSILRRYCSSLAGAARA